MTITKKLAALLSGVVLSAGIFRVVQASPADYAAYFKVDLNEPLPKYADLERKYLVEKPARPEKFRPTKPPRTAKQPVF